MNIQEKLVSIRAARAEAEKQWADYKEGKSQDKPSVEVKSFDMVEKMLLNTMGDFSKGRVTVQETLHSTDAVKLIPKVIEGQLREAAEPVYLATRFMKTIQVNDGASAVYVIPVVGELTARDL